MERNVRRDETKNKNAQFFPGGHIIADSESASAYAIVVAAADAVVVGFIQLASSPPRLHFAVACGTGRYAKANCGGNQNDKKTKTKITTNNDETNEKREIFIYLVCGE